jgi:hypothetical protein
VCAGPALTHSHFATSEGTRVTRAASIGGDVVDAIRHGLAKILVGEVMLVDLSGQPSGRSTPSSWYRSRTPVACVASTAALICSNRASRSGLLLLPRVLRFTCRRYCITPSSLGRLLSEVRCPSHAAPPLVSRGSSTPTTAGASNRPSSRAAAFDAGFPAELDPPRSGLFARCPSGEPRQTMSRGHGDPSILARSCWGRSRLPATSQRSHRNLRSLPLPPQTGAEPVHLACAGTPAMAPDNKCVSSSNPPPRRQQ